MAKCFILYGFQSEEERLQQDKDAKKVGMNLLDNFVPFGSQ